LGCRIIKRRFVLPGEICHDDGIKRLAATLAGFDGAYLRFSGQCRVQYFRAGALAEEFADKAIWELMYFGHAR
jgi:hypothetical protein